MEADANAHDHTSCTINHNSSSEGDKNSLDRFRFTANEVNVLNTSHGN